MHLVVVGGSDAGISAALRARELAADCEVTVVVADGYPNFSICGIPYYVSGEVHSWRDLAHRSIADLETTGMVLRLNTTARQIRADRHEVVLAHVDASEEVITYDALIIGTGAAPVRPPIEGLTGPTALGSPDGVHLLRSMGDTFELMHTLASGPRSAVIVGAGYIGLEMAECLTARGLAVTQIEQLPEVLASVDPELGAIIRSELEQHGVEVLCGTKVTSIRRSDKDSSGHLAVDAIGEGGAITRYVDVVLVVVGVRPDSQLAYSAGVQLTDRGAIVVDHQMRTNLPDLLAAGDCATTYHRLLGDTYLPLGTTAHKQGRVAGEAALGGTRTFAGSLGTQVVKVFNVVVARTGIRDDEAHVAGFDSLTISSVADDHKAYYPGSHQIVMHYTGDRKTGRLLGLQLVGHLDSEIAKRIDIAASAIFHGMAVDEMNDLDLAYTPPLGSPWDALQIGAQRWSAARGPR